MTLASAVSGAAIIHSWYPPRPRLLWNATASAPIGLYRIAPDAPVRLGDLVAVLPPPDAARLMAERHYLPLRVPLLKHVAARQGATICRRGATVTIDGRAAAVARARDTRNRPLPAWNGCRILRATELFLLNPAPDSMDGRYFGPTPITGLLGRATPIWTRDGPNTPLRWRSARDRSAPCSPANGMSPCQ